MKKNLFNNVIYKGILGTISGIVAGLIFGVLIWCFQTVALLIFNIVQGRYYTYYEVPFNLLITLGMSFGAIIGSIFGCLTGLREEKHK